MTKELISIEKTADMLDISYTSVKKLIEKDLIKMQGSQVIRKSVVDLIDMRDDALNRQDVLKYVKCSTEKLRHDIKDGLFPEPDFKIGKFFY